jgi:ribose 5-phosphate isomerase B
MKIAIGNDHAGTSYKFIILKHLESQHIKVYNYGTDSDESVDYPDFVHPVAQQIEKKEADLGILICGSANGVAMTANKYKNIRAGISWNTEISSLIKQHNNANILCIPARFTKQKKILEIVDVFLKTKFEGGRHQRRIDKISLNC